MSEKLTPEDVAEGLRLDAARTQGEWVWWGLSAQATSGPAFAKIIGPTEVSRDRMSGLKPEDAGFIAHATNHYVTALREVGRLRAALELVAEAAEEAVNCLDRPGSECSPAGVRFAVSEARKLLKEADHA